MFKKLIFTIILLFIFPAFSEAAQQSVSVTAESAILINAKNGQILYSKEPHQHRHPASTTKVATTMTAIHIGKLDEIVTVSKKAANIGESSIHLNSGEKISLNQLITGALIKSGNDACVAIAEGLAGTEKKFMELVNNRIRMLGAGDTAFVNSNGLPAEEHYSCAYDLALISKYAMLSEKFSELVSTRYARLNRENNWQQSLRNTNKLLWRYSGATGIKTGTTNKAGNCLIASARRNDMYLISVVLHSDDRYGDSIKLLDYGFENFKPEVVIEKGETVEKLKVPNSDNGKADLPLVAGDSIEILTSLDDGREIYKKVNINSNIKAPVKAGDKLGEIRITYGEKTAGYSELIAGNSVSQRRFIPEFFE